MLPTVEGVSGDAGALQQRFDRDVVLAQGDRRAPGRVPCYRRQRLLSCLSHVDAAPTKTSLIWQRSAGRGKSLVAHGRRDEGGRLGATSEGSFEPRPALAVAAAWHLKPGHGPQKQNFGPHQQVALEARAYIQRPVSRNHEVIDMKTPLRLALLASSMLAGLSLGLEPASAASSAADACAA